ncbi:hypothetical protein [Caudoviricetes sp.]|nr:hypothetical protein [Caudoviricetes sp.]UOF81891.1 hypothetical protein [Caudoviricetes sp.]
MIQRLPLPLEGGVNLHSDPSSLKPNQWQLLQNVAPRPSGRIGQRPALQFQREVVPSWWHWDARALTGSLGVASAIPGYYRWARDLRPLKFMFDPNFGEISMVAFNTVAMQVYDQNGMRVTPRTVPIGTAMLFTLPGVWVAGGSEPVPLCAVLGQMTRSPSLFSFLGQTYAFGGETAGSYVGPPVGSVYSAQTGFDYVSVQFGQRNEATGALDYVGTNNGFAPEQACVLRDRVVYSIGSNVYFSDRNDPMSVGASALSSRGINVCGEEQEQITALSEVSLSAEGSPAQSALVVWTRTHCYLVTGEPGESDAETAEEIIGSTQINRLNVKAGCVSQASVVRTPYGMFWVGVDDVWFMPFGSTPLRVGTNLRPMLANQPAGVQWKIHADYYNGSLRIGVFGDGSGPSLYSPCDEQWWLDLRNEPPTSPDDAAWFGPQVFVNHDGVDQDLNPISGVYCIAKDERSTGDGRLYALQPNFMANPYTTVYGMTLCTLDEYSSRDITAPTYPQIAWVASNSYAEGDMLTALQPAAVASQLATVWVCTVAGTSGLTEPIWPTAASFVVDGGVTWTALYWNGTTVLSGYQSELWASTYGTNSIECELLSREVMTDDPMVEKLLDGAELGFFTPSPTRVTYNSHPDQAIKTKVLPSPVWNANANLPGNTVTAVWNGQRKWSSRLLPSGPTQRFQAQSASWYLKQNAGFVLTNGVDNSFMFTWASVVRTATVASGYYADITSLLAAAIAAMNTAVGLTQFTSTIADDGAITRSRVGIKTIDESSLTLSVTAATDKLLFYLGYNPSQSGLTSSGYVYGALSPRGTLSPPIEFSGINLRLALWGRRPL